MNVLFVHQNCPGQFKHLAPRLAASPDNQVVFITRPGKPNLPGVRQATYTPQRKPGATTHPYLRQTEEGVLNGQAAARAALDLKKAGFKPDLIVAHVGWGEALYLKYVWPNTPLLGYFEWFYHPFGSDVDFDPKAPPTLDDICRINTRNSLHLLNLETADWGITPTRWQWQQHPARYRENISIIHDGVDILNLRPDASTTGTLKEGLRLKAGEEIVTYVARNLEPYRGFPSFMRAAEIILKRRPNARILVVGGDGVSYGRAPANGRTYRENLLAEVDIDLDRIHFLGRVKYEVFRRVLLLSAAHIYLTVPFVLSWSMLEAMAAGCAVIGSRTAPVEEVIRDGHNGLLVDFFDPLQIADSVDQVLNHTDRMQRLRNAARQTVVERYALEACLQQQVRLIERLARPRARVSRQSPEQGLRASRKRVKKHAAS